MIKSIKHDSMKVHGSIQREDEIKAYGKIISLHPSVSRKSNQIYNRKEKGNFLNKYLHI